MANRRILWTAIWRRVSELLPGVALLLSGVGQARLDVPGRYPQWLTAPYLFMAGFLLLVLATWRPRRPATPGLRQWLGLAAVLAVALVCSVLAVRQFRHYDGFAAGLLLTSLGIAAAGAALGASSQPSLTRTWGSALGGESYPPRAPGQDSARRLRLSEAGLSFLVVAAMGVALRLWWLEKSPNLAFAVNASAFLCVLWLALRLDRRSVDPAPNTHHASRTTHHVSRFTHHVSRITFHASRPEFLALTLILLAALFLRTYRLLDMPYGVWYDEGEAGLEAIKFYEGAPFSPMGRYSPNNPSLFFYLTAVAFKLLGPDLWTLRVVTAAIGVATVAAAYFLFRLLLGRKVALIAAGLLAASSWHVNFSRIGMGYTTLVPFFETVTLYFLVRGIRHGRWTDFVLGGLMLGLGMYSHTSFRVFPLVVVIFALYGLISQRQVRRRFLGLVVAGVVSIMVFAPLGMWAVKHPIAFGARMAQTSFIVGHDTPQSALRALKSNVEKHALMFNVRGDRNGRHNLPGAPQLDGVSAALLVLGAGYTVYRWRDADYFLLAAWFTVALLGGVLSLDWEAPQAARAIGAIPAVYGMAAVPLALAWQSWHDSGRFPAILSTLTVGTLLLASLYLNYDRYFNHQHRDSEVFHAFSTPDTAIARYVQMVGDDRYRFYLQNQFTPVYRFLNYSARPAPGRQEAFFQAIDHLPVRGTVDRDVMYVLEPWRVATPIDEFLRYYPGGAYEEVADPFGKTMFYSFTVRQADVEAIAGLTGRYYAASDLTGDPVQTRHDRTLDFDWTDGSPLGDGPLSVQWDGALFAPQSGTYALGTRSPGRSQVFLDGELVVESSGGTGSGEGWAEDIRVLARGWHRLVVTCQDCNGGVIQLYWNAPGAEAEIVPPDALSTVSVAEHGLRGDYYAGPEPIELPVFTQVDPTISFRWHDDPIPVPWNAQWTGWLDVETAGEHQFQLFSNDQAGLYLDEQPILSGGGRFSGSARLDEGAHAIRVTYSNTRHYSELRLFWIPPGATTWEPIPTERLRPESVASEQRTTVYCSPFTVYCSLTRRDIP